MAKYLLDVPTAEQAKSMSCWHASAQMIWWYWQAQSGRQGPMNTLAKAWADDTGLAVNVQDFVRLARKTGLKAVPRQIRYDADDLEYLLRKYGPIWCAGTWYGFGHVIVLTGIDGQKVNLNDPDGGVKKHGTVSWFNDKMMNHIDGCFMYKDPGAY